MIELAAAFTLSGLFAILMVFGGMFLGLLFVTATAFMTSALEAVVTFTRALGAPPSKS